MPRLKKRNDGRYCQSITVEGKKKYFYGQSQKEIDKKIADYYYALANPYRSFESVADEWREIHEPEVAYKTWSSYQAHLNALLLEFEDMDIKDINHIMISNMLKRMARQGFSDASVRKRLVVCRLIMEHALFNYYITDNPCNIARVPKGLKKSTRELPSEEERKKVLNSLDCHFGLFAYFLLFTGLRRGEALAMKWENVDFEKNKISVSKSVYFESNRPKEKETKTTNSVREVPLLKPLKDVLSPLQKETGYLFGGEKLMTEQTFRRAWQRYLKESGVTITPHQLRHAFATILFEAEISEKSAQHILGHSDYQTTVEIYTHISEVKIKSDSEKLESFVANL